MFLPVLESQASDAQLTKWHQDALNYRIIGWYGSKHNENSKWNKSSDFIN